MTAGDPTPNPPHSKPARTAQHLIAAAKGDEGSLTWVVERFDACLHAAARHQLGPRLQAHYDPGDLVNEVWSVVLRRLPETEFVKQGPTTAAMLSFLTAILRNLVNNLLRKHIRGQADFGSTSGDPLDRLPDTLTGVTTRARLSELRQTLASTLEGLDPDDREVILLRAIEQVPSADVAAILGISSGAVAVRLHRALKRLKEALPDSVLNDLGLAEE